MAIINANQLNQIRINPDMYGGSKSTPTHALQEAVDNGIDQILIKKADHLWITFHEDGSYSVFDNGEGMPVEVAETANGDKMPTNRMAWTVPNTSGHYTQQATTSIGKNGIGTKFVTATSTKTVGTILKDGKWYQDIYTLDPEVAPAFKDKSDKAAKLLSRSPLIYETKLNRNHQLPSKTLTQKLYIHGQSHGTELRFWPDPDIYDSVAIDWTAFKDRLHQQAFLNPEASFTLINEATGEEVSYHEPEGLKAYVEYVFESSKEDNEKLITGIHGFSGRIETNEGEWIGADVAFAWTDGATPRQRSFVNSVATPDGGTHVSGFNAGVRRMMNNYADKLGLTKDSIDSRDLQPGLVAIISANHTKPQYTGQTKDKLSNVDAKTAIDKITYEQGQFEWDKYITDVEAVIKQALERAALRRKIDDLSKIKLDSKDMKAKVSKKLKPAKKLRGARGVEQAELFITEGDSASGSLTRTRINGEGGMYQAIFPIRGKIINALTSTSEKVFANTEVSTIFSAIGAGIGDKYDESKLNYDKIIIASDSDSDGDNIFALLITLFSKYTPQLLENGHVYRAQAPLFINYDEKGNTDYIYTERDQQVYLETHDPKLVERAKGLGEVGDPMTRETLITPGTRHLTQYTTNDIEASTELVDLLMGKEVAPRRAFLMENAEFAHIEE